MTTAFAALLLGVAGAALVLALVAYLWVNRTPSVDERFDEYGRVPLFGVDQSAVAKELQPKVEASESEDAGEATPVPARRARSAEDVMADRPSPVGNPIFIDTSAVDHQVASSTLPPTEASSNGNYQSFAPPAIHLHVDPPSVTPPVAPAMPSKAQPNSEPLTPRRGWGATPGWPVAANNGLSATPKYVPSVRADEKNSGMPPAGIANGNASAAGNGTSADGVPGSMIEGHQLRFTAPAEGTLQFLPGRLEISSGLDTGREIRFVRVPGPNGTEVTFGRNEGPLYRHIQLRDQTVSREHARLVFGEGHWVLTNLSKTNPVAHNGRILRLAEQQPLTDGDRLEMGEVVFNFHSR